MGALYRKSGDVIDVTPESSLGSGVLVTVGNIVGITKFPIAAGTLGVITVRGLFDGVAKGVGALTAGQDVYCNPSDRKIYGTAAPGYLPCGKAVKAAASNDTTCSILLIPVGADHKEVSLFAVDHTPGSDVAVGSLVVIGSLVGYAEAAISANATGSLRTAGLVKGVTKHNSSNALTDGQIVYVNPSNGKVYNAPATGYIKCGYAIGAATASSSTCNILLVNALEASS